MINNENKPVVYVQNPALSVFLPYFLFYPEDLPAALQGI